MLENMPIISDFFTGCASIFMLHRVEDFDSNRLFSNENMKVSPRFLEGFIVDGKKNGYDFISLNELNTIS